MVGRIKILTRTYKVYEANSLPRGDISRSTYSKPSIWVSISENKSKRKYQSALQVMVNNAMAYEIDRMSMSKRLKHDLLEAQDIAGDGVTAILGVRWK